MRPCPTLADADKHHRCLAKESCGQTQTSVMLKQGSCGQTPQVSYKNCFSKAINYLAQVDKTMLCCDAISFFDPAFDLHQECNAPHQVQSGAKK